MSTASDLLCTFRGQGLRMKTRLSPLVDYTFEESCIPFYLLIFLKKWAFIWISLRYYRRESVLSGGNANIVPK